MKRDLRVAIAQISVKPYAIEENIEKCVHWLEMAVKEHHAELVVYPETITTGFAPGMLLEEFYNLVTFIPGSMTQKIVEAAKKLKVHVVFPTYERGETPGVIYNSSVLIDDLGNIVGIYRKTHPFPTENISAGGWTTPGREAKVFETRLGKIGMIICYDGDFPELSRVLAVQGAEIIVRPSALLRSYDIWSLTNHARAYDNHVYFIGANAVGADAANNFYFGSSMIISPIGEKLAQARGGDEIISAVLDHEPLKYVSPGSHNKMVFNHIEDRNLEVYQEHILKPAQSPFQRG
jgi:beta-ureidopropionase